jgi:uncharacterized protein (TIGR03086 family)
MADTVDLEPAARQLADVVEHVQDSQLGDQTPAGASTVGDLVDHVGGLARAFTAAARKDLGATTAAAPAPDAKHLDSAWRTTIPAAVTALAQAWTDPSAWDGMTQAGGVTLPGAVAGRVALHEVVLHGWDLARATGQPYQPDDTTVDACLTSLSEMYPPDDLDRRQGIFGPPVDVAPDAPALDRVLGLSGRSPDWSPG